MKYHRTNIWSAALQCLLLRDLHSSPQVWFLGCGSGSEPVTVWDAAGTRTRSQSHAPELFRLVCWFDLNWFYQHRPVIFKQTGFFAVFSGFMSNRSDCFLSWIFTGSALAWVRLVCWFVSVLSELVRLKRSWYRAHRPPSTSHSVHIILFSSPLPSVSFVPSSPVSFFLLFYHSFCFSPVQLKAREKTTWIWKCPSGASIPAETGWDLSWSCTHQYEHKHKDAHTHSSGCSFIHYLIFISLSI